MPSPAERARCASQIYIGKPRYKDRSVNGIIENNYIDKVIQ